MSIGEKFNQAGNGRRDSHNKKEERPVFTKGGKFCQEYLSRQWVQDERGGKEGEGASWGGGRGDLLNFPIDVNLGHTLVGRGREKGGKEGKVFWASCFKPVR